MKVFVDKDTCTACALCYDIAPDVLDEGDDGFPEVLEDEFDESLRDEAEDAADQCPSGSIEVE